MNGVRWNDDRLDDLARLVASNNERVSRMHELLTKHDDALVRIMQKGDRRSDRGFQIWMIVLGQLATIIAIFVDIALTAH